MKTEIGIVDLKALAGLAKRNGTEEAALDCAVQWAEGAHEEIERLRQAKDLAFKSEARMTSEIEALRTAAGAWRATAEENVSLRFLLREIREWLTGGDGGDDATSAIEVASKINAVLQPNICREP